MTNTATTDQKRADAADKIAVELQVLDMDKTAKIDRAIYLATVMQEKALAHAELVARFNDVEDETVEMPQVSASADRWVEAKRELRDFLAMAL